MASATDPQPITDAERAELEQLRALAKIQNQRPQLGADEVDPEQLVASRALLADGTMHDYVGAHPTHVDNDNGRVPVLAVYNV